MNDFKTRLINERSELSVKHISLESFLDSEKVNNIPYDQLVLLRIQCDIMSAYLGVLDSRLRLLI